MISLADLFRLLLAAAADATHQSRSQGDPAAKRVILSAVATAIAAVVTAGMAFETWRLAQQTQDLAGSTKVEADAVVQQTALSSAATRTQTRPWLTIDPDAGIFKHVLHVNGKMSLEIALKNHGNGLALIPADSAFVLPPTDAAQNAVPYFARMTASVVPAGGTTVFTVNGALPPIMPWWFSNLDTLGSPNSRGRVEITYTDANGQQETTARLILSRLHPEEPWSVTQIEYRECAAGAGDAHPPIAVLQFGTHLDLQPETQARQQASPPKGRAPNGRFSVRTTTQAKIEISV